jgi:CRISPR-associated protein Cas2
MIALITYDISDNSTRRHFHVFLKEFGLNTQKSVFECEIDESALKTIKAKAVKIIDPETDSVRIYRLCSRCVKKTQVSGQGIKVVSLDFLVV